MVADAGCCPLVVPVGGPTLGPADLLPRDCYWLTLPTDGSEIILGTKRGYNSVCPISGESAGQLKIPGERRRAECLG